MTEPHLTYKKGQGWVYETFTSTEGSLRGPNRERMSVRFELRFPEIGEHYTWIFKPDRDWFEDNGYGDMRLEFMKQAFYNYEPRDFGIMTKEDRDFYQNNIGSHTREFITVVL